MREFWDDMLLRCSPGVNPEEVAITVVLNHYKGTGFNPVQLRLINGAKAEFYRLQGIYLYKVLVQYETDEASEQEADSGV